MRYEYVDENLKVKIFLKNKGNLLANASIVLNTIFLGFVTIKNFQIWKSKNLNTRLGEAINIVPTSVRQYRQVFIEERDKWFDLELIIYESFIKAKNGNVNEDIDPDEIDKALSKS